MTLSLEAPMTSKDRMRFRFGKNWARFLAVLDDERIAQAESSLKEMLEVSDLRGRSFLDAGSGSGLFSLSARRLGATLVRSFDYDADSVACTRELKRRFYPDDAEWAIDQGSVLDPEYLAELGRFDIVYSWGVLHHTGSMWEALANVSDLVKPGGRLFIAIYNDQGRTSRRWRMIKRAYNRSPAPIKLGLVLAVGGYEVCRSALGRLLSLSNPLSVVGDLRSERRRGMSLWHDLVDWVGGYPFEVAKPEEVLDFCRVRGFVLQRLKTVGGGLGNNQFVLVRQSNEAGGSGGSNDIRGDARIA
jgi:2-polyprenyl-3-methyl-5-hydroxy-6-metoxy-1,4-benzoquinol methylase